MDLSIITKSYRQLGRAITKNSPTILTALGAAGVVATVILAIKATPKALELIEAEETFRSEELSDDRPLDALDVIAATWKCYIPTATMSLTTIACIIGANHISMRRNAALASLFTITETALKEYQAKVVEQIGEKKAEKIQSEITQDHLDKHPVNDKTVIFTGNGNYLCFDDFSKRYFRSDVEALRRAENRFNQRLIRNMYLPINEFYYEIGLEPIELGDELGWIAERAILELRFDTKMAKDTNEPCLVINYIVTPHHI